MSSESDLVERLRLYAVRYANDYAYCVASDLDKAADEIERLRTERDDALALAAKLNGEVEAMRRALEPFAKAAGGIPTNMNDAHHIARISNDARAPGTVTTITAAEFRAALLPTSQAGEEK